MSVTISAARKIESKMPEAVERALEIGRKRRAYLQAMQDAIRLGDKDGVFEIARKLTGLIDEECDRTDTRLN